MRVLLVGINAKYCHMNPAIYSLRSSAGEFKKDIELAEYTINQRFDEILADIYRRKPDLVAFSCYVWNIELVEKLITVYHNLVPDTILWLGGPEASMRAEELLTKYTELEGIIIGEGEDTLQKILKYDGHAGKFIYGIAFGRDTIDGFRAPTEGFIERNGIKLTGERAPLQLVNLPFMYDDVSEDFWSKPIIYYETSRGCPYSCTYCLSSLDKEVRFRDWKQIKQELDIFLQKNVRQVKFIDRTFNCNKIHARRIWRYLAAHDNGVTNFHFEVNGDLLEKDDFVIFAGIRPGFFQIEIGIQTLKPEALKAIQRSQDFSLISEAVRTITSQGNVHVHVDLIAGLPYDDFLSFQETFNSVYALHAHQLQLGFLKVLKGTLLERESGQFGLVHNSFAPYEIFESKWISFEQMQRLKKIENVLEIYSNSGQFKNSIRFAEHFFDNPYQMFEKIAEFYDKRTKNGAKLSRMKQAELLLDVLKDRAHVLPQNKILSQESILGQMLTYDLYLRERDMARPVFALYKENLKELMDNFPDIRRECHTEYFSVDVEKTAASGEAITRECLAVFDYDDREPLYNNARVSLKDLG